MAKVNVETQTVSDHYLYDTFGRTLVRLGHTAVQ